jgi:hypothetical protein
MAVTLIESAHTLSSSKTKNLDILKPMMRGIAPKVE